MRFSARVLICFVWVIVLSLPLILMGCAAAPMLARSPTPPATPPPSYTPPPASVMSDVVVYGATPAGITAAIEAARLDKVVTLLEGSRHVGGMASSGLGVSDIYGRKAIGGLAATFFQTVAAINGAADFSSHPGTLFEPHVAEQAFLQMLAAEKNITLVLGAPVENVAMLGTTIEALNSTNGIAYVAQEFIDASYEGDLMAAAHVSYVVGREASSQYSEAEGGVRLPAAMGGVSVDPYVVPGDASSGLLPHVESDPLGAPGSADASVMAYNYRLCISTDAANQIPFEEPDGYNPAEYEVLGRYVAALRANHRQVSVDTFFLSGNLPNKKMDLNNNGAFSTDDVGVSAGFSNADPDARLRIASEHKRYMQGLMYFMETDPHVPPQFHAIVQSWGLCKDEFQDNGGWPYLLYQREGRRMVGAHVLTENDVESSKDIAEPIGRGGYPLDSHLENRVAVNGEIENEGGCCGRAQLYYQIPYRILTPLESQAANLLVVVDVSASHVAYESLRVEPTYMIMGQAAGAAASLAIDEKTSVQGVKYSTLASQLLRDGQSLTAE